MSTVHAVIVGLCCLAVAACAPTGGGAAGSRGGQDATSKRATTPASAGWVTPESPAPPAPITAGPSPAPRGPLAGTGALTVATRASSYRLGEVIELTVTNVGGASVFTEDQRADCTIVVLERRTGETWQPVGSCGAERAPFVVEIRPGERLDVRIDPRSTNFSPAVGALAAVPGTYRASVGYRNSPAPTNGTSALSPPFTVAP